MQKTGGAERGQEGLKENPGKVEVKTFLKIYKLSQRELECRNTSYPTGGTRGKHSFLMHHSGEANVQRVKLIRVRTKRRAEEHSKKNNPPHSLEWNRRLWQTAVDPRDGQLAFIFQDIVKDSQPETSLIVWLIAGLLQCSNCSNKARQKGFFILRLTAGSQTAHFDPTRRFSTQFKVNWTKQKNTSLEAFSLIL